MDTQCPNCGEDIDDSDLADVEGVCLVCGATYDMECFMTPEGATYMYPIWHDWLDYL